MADNEGMMKRSHYLIITIVSSIYTFADRSSDHLHLWHDLPHIRTGNRHTASWYLLRSKSSLNRRNYRCLAGTATRTYEVTLARLVTWRIR